MEKETYNKITGYMTAMNFSSQPSHLGKKVDINDPIVAKALVDFNGTHADEEANSGQMEAKIQILNDALAKLGYSQKLVWANKADGGTDGYNKDTAYENRDKNLKGLDPTDYPNAILKTDKDPQ
ncbi:hypothetical protein AAKU61_004337 [Undibacterium sp. GrIS 1.2]|uniref:hypothetical protein n=1 Tax=Undibacterium sp. GrIS 1.2 TaxID=3143933 RepID=UPI003399C87D